jgi:hypothetical protein
MLRAVISVFLEARNVFFVTYQTVKYMSEKKLQDTHTGSHPTRALARARVCTTNAPLIPTVNSDKEGGDKGVGGNAAPHLLRAQAPRASLWPRDKRKLTVSFSSADFDLDGEMSYCEAKIFVRRVVERECNGLCGITFEFIADTHYDRADVRITFNAALGSWSMVGNEAIEVPARDPTMNLGWLDSDRQPSGGVILHEFGHALGLIHEHSTAKFPYCWNREGVIAELTGPPNNWTVGQVEHNVFDIVDSSLLSGQSSDYDGDSVMGYSFPASYFLHDTNGCTNPPPNGIEQRLCYSSTDIATLRRLYPKDPHTSEDTTTDSQWGVGAIVALVAVVVAFMVALVASTMNVWRRHGAGDIQKTSVVIIPLATHAHEAAQTLPLPQPTASTVPVEPGPGPSQPQAVK